MAAVLLWKRLLPRPKMYRSLCQVTDIRDSGDVMESRFPPDPIPDGMMFNRWFRMETRLCLTRFCQTADVPSYTPVLFVERDYPERKIKDEDSGPAVGITFEGHGLPYGSLYIRMNVYSLDAPSVSTLNWFLQEFLRNNPRDRIARPYLSHMLVYGTIPDLSTFSTFIKSYCKHHTYQHVHDVVFVQMKALGVKPNLFFYKRLMDGVCAHFGSIVGYQLLKELRSSHGIRMPLSCYNAIVRPLCSRKMIGDAAVVLLLIDVLMDMKQQRIFPDDKICNCLLKGRGHGGESFINALGLGRQMFAKGIRTRAVSLMKPFPQWTSELDPYPLP